MTIHDIIYALYPEIKRIVEPDLDAYDAEGNPVEYDLAVVQAKAAELEADKQAKAQAVIAARQSALDKLMALGLTEEEALALGARG